MSSEKYAYNNNDDDDDYEPCSKKIMPSLFAWFLLISSTSAYFTLVLPMCLDLIGFERLYLFIAVAVSHAILFFYVVINLTIATFMDPGRFPKVDIHEAIENDSSQQSGNYKNVLINDINVRMKWCTTCQFYRPPRSSHCGVCNACIDTMDHHCPWVCNCIARRNYKYFLQFLISLTIHMLIVFGVCLTFALINKENMTNIPVIVAILLVVLIGILIIPIGGLTGFHIILVSRGRTTNEQVTGKFRTGVNPFDDGCIQNWSLTLCLSLPPSYIEFRKKKQRLKEYYETRALMITNRAIKDKSSITTSSVSRVSTPGLGIGGAVNQKLLNNNESDLNTENKVKYTKTYNNNYTSEPIVTVPLNNKNDLKNQSNKKMTSNGHKQLQQLNNEINHQMHENVSDLELQQYLENKKLQDDALAVNRQRKQSKNNKNNLQNHQQIWLENNYNNKNYDNLIGPDLIQINEHPLPPQPTNKKQLSHNNIKQSRNSKNHNKKEHVIINIANNNFDNGKQKCVRNNSYINANHTNVSQPIIIDDAVSKPIVNSKKIPATIHENGDSHNHYNNYHQNHHGSSSSTKHIKNKKKSINHNHNNNNNSNNVNSNSNNNNSEMKSSQDYATYEITV